jgi:hypothetical protein
MKMKIAILIVLALASFTALADPPPGSVAQLESDLDIAAMPVGTAEYKAKLQSEENDYSIKMLGHADNDDFNYVGEAYAKAYDKGKQVCDTWMAGKSDKVKAAAKVYCALWKSTLQARADAHANQDDFASTPAGAQFVRAQAELEAAADE